MSDDERSNDDYSIASLLHRRKEKTHEAGGYEKEEAEQDAASCEAAIADSARMRQEALDISLPRLLRAGEADNSPKKKKKKRKKKKEEFYENNAVTADVSLNEDFVVEETMAEDWLVHRDGDFVAVDKMNMASNMADDGFENENINVAAAAITMSEASSKVESVTSHDEREIELSQRDADATEEWSSHTERDFVLTSQQFDINIRSYDPERLDKENDESNNIASERDTSRVSDEAPGIDSGDEFNGSASSDAADDASTGKPAADESEVFVPTSQHVAIAIRSDIHDREHNDIHSGVSEQGSSLEEIPDDDPSASLQGDESTTEPAADDDENEDFALGSNGSTASTLHDDASTTEPAADDDEDAAFVPSIQHVVFDGRSNADDRNCENHGTCSGTSGQGASLDSAPGANPGEEFDDSTASESPVDETAAGDDVEVFVPLSQHLEIGIRALDPSSERYDSNRMDGKRDWESGAARDVSPPATLTISQELPTEEVATNGDEEKSMQLFVEPSYDNPFSNSSDTSLCSQSSMAYPLANEERSIPIDGEYAQASSPAVEIPWPEQHAEKAREVDGLERGTTADASATVWKRPSARDDPEEALPMAPYREASSRPSRPKPWLYIFFGTMLFLVFALAIAVGVILVQQSSDARSSSLPAGTSTESPPNATLSAATAAASATRAPSAALAEQPTVNKTATGGAPPPTLAPTATRPTLGPTRVRPALSLRPTTPRPAPPLQPSSGTVVLMPNITPATPPRSPAAAAAPIPGPATTTATTAAPSPVVVFGVVVPVLARTAAPAVAAIAATVPTAPGAAPTPMTAPVVVARPVVLVPTPTNSSSSSSSITPAPTLASIVVAAISNSSAPAAPP